MPIHFTNIAVLKYVYDDLGYNFFFYQMKDDTHSEAQSTDGKTKRVTNAKVSLPIPH